MAELTVTPDPFIPGRWSVRSSNPSALAATCDAVVQVLQLEGEALAVWALHHDEQQGPGQLAYEDERREIGPLADIRIMELPRPPKQNVVWVDRVHLLASAVHPTVGSRLLGLYVGSKGRLVLAVHHQSVTAIVAGAFEQLPDDRRAWDDQQLVDQCRVVLRYDQSSPGEVEVRAPQPMALQVNDALGRLALLVAGW